ncbi:hypothetical protein IC611_01440 [Proteus mirabilis]
MGLALSPATTSLPTMGQRTSFSTSGKRMFYTPKGGAASMAAKMGASAGIGRHKWPIFACPDR